MTNMTDDHQFIDYYQILQVSPNCDAKRLESAYHLLAKLHHPDHTGTADTTKFNDVIQAYKVLRHPDKRASYDRLYAKNVDGKSQKFRLNDEIEVEENAALDDADDHNTILAFLYKKRREDAQNAGVVAFYIQEILNCTHEHFEFHKWYLKEKGFIVTTEQGTLAITVQGIDHVIATSRTTQAERLLISQPDDLED